MKYILRSLFIFVISLQYNYCDSQEISNIHFEQVGKQIHIFYDLQGDQEYAVQVFCSTDNGQTWGEPLKKVTGAVGEGQKPGNSKEIVWDVLAEREKLAGEVRFKIEAGLGNSGIFKDTRDGQTYKWVKIGQQFWMAENLNFKTKSGSWAYNNDPNNATIYGRLYDWNTAKKVCPVGWHLPSHSEWSVLIKFLGGRNTAGGKMKETGNIHWKNPNEGATNSSNFSALPGGYRRTDGGFGNLGHDGNWWSATASGSPSAWGRNLDYYGDEVYRYYTNKDYGFSVRCLRD